MKLALLLCCLMPAAAQAEDAEGAWRVKVDGRLGLGVGTQLRGLLERSFALEAGLTGRVALSEAFESSRTAVLMPEVSYAGLYPGGERTSHALVLGLGLGRWNDGLVYGVVPAFVYAAMGQEGARQVGYGARFLATVELFRGFGLQVGYEAVSYPEELVHQVRVTASINALFLAGVGLVLSR